MRRPAWLPWPPRPARGEKQAAPPLAAQLDNPYTPRFGAPRRFEDLARRREGPAPAPPRKGR